MNQPYPSRTFDEAGAEHLPVTDRHFHYLGIRVPNGWMSAAFTFGLGGSALLSSAADTKLGVYTFLALSGLIVLLFPHFALKANMRNAILWTYPAWAIFSTVWSIDSDRTLHSILLLIPSVIATMATGAMPDRRAANAGAAVALIAYIAYSLVVGGSIYFADSSGGGAALSGITTGKNYFGHISAMSLIMSVSLLTFVREERGIVLVGLGLFGAAASGFALLKSHATGSIITGFGSLGIIIAAMLFRRVIWQFRVVLIAAIIGVIIVYLTYGQELQEEFFAYILKTFNKDATLTGRTFLWDYADRLIGEKPALGYGFNAFWYFTNPEAWTLWRTMGVRPMSGFNFHNTPREILIEGGWVGLGLCLATVGFAFVTMSLRTLVRGDLTSAVRLGFVVYFILRMSVESSGYVALTIDMLLVFGFLCRPVLTTGERIVASEPAERTRPREDMIRWREPVEN